MSASDYRVVPVGTVATRLPFVQKFIEAGIIPPMVKDFSIRFAYDDIVTVRYNCFAPEELVSEDVAEEIIQDAALVGANVDNAPIEEASSAPG